MNYFPSRKVELTPWSSMFQFHQFFIVVSQCTDLQGTQYISTETDSHMCTVLRVPSQPTRQSGTGVCWAWHDAAQWSGLVHPEMPIYAQYTVYIQCALLSHVGFTDK